MNMCIHVNKIAVLVEFLNFEFVAIKMRNVAATVGWFGVILDIQLIWLKTAYKGLKLHFFRVKIVKLLL